MLKLLFSRLSAPKYTRKGKCKQCGQCCRNIKFKIGERFVQSPGQWEDIKKWDKRYKHFYISGKDEEGFLAFTCKSIAADNKCKNYLFRSLYCRNYPFVKFNFFAKFFGHNFQTLEGCGYSIVVSKFFIDYLK